MDRLARNHALRTFVFNALVHVNEREKSKRAEIVAKLKTTLNFSQDPQPLPYLRHSDPYSLNVDLEVAIKGNLNYKCKLLHLLG